MFAPVWQRVTGGQHRQIPARLDGYARFAVRDASYPGIVAQPGASVDGVLYLDLAPAELALLDRFEGSEYARLPVPVTCQDGKQVDAQTYVYLDRAHLSGAPWDPERFDLAAFIGQHCR